MADRIRYTGSGKLRSTRDYKELDDAIWTIRKWWPEIVAEGAVQGVSEQTISTVKQIMRTVYDTWEDDSCSAAT